MVVRKSDKKTNYSKVIEMFNSSNNYYERILFDMGFPDDDIIELLDCLEIKKDGL